MCGIAGIADVEGERAIPAGVLRVMASTLFHRGPDQDGFLERRALGIASRRLSIVGLGDGRQPISNEDQTVHVVFNGEIFDYPELKSELEGRGHRFVTHCDTELLPHLWEEHQEQMFAHLSGQFAFALWDERRRLLILARDRLGICPLYWTEQRTGGGHWLLFASEIKALLRSGLIEAQPDLRGIDHALTFFALPGPVTCFEGVQSLLPGHFLSVQFSHPGEPALIRDHTYWEIDFPDRGTEVRDDKSGKLLDQYEGLVTHAVARRLRADVPVVSYLSGGVDSSLVLSMASRIGGQPLPAFTLQITAARLDETSKAAEAAAHVGVEPRILPCGMDDIVAAYPRLTEAAECPVSDTCCAALLLLAEDVHRQGYKVALTGEGADETLAGYPWFKSHKLIEVLDILPGLALSRPLRRGVAHLLGARPFSRAYQARIEEAVGGYTAWQDLYDLVSLSKPRFYGPRLRELLGTYVPYADLGLNVERFRRWHPLNQSLYLGLRIHLAGLLLSVGGDRVAMHSSLETRYPFLDEDVVGFLARLDPRLKLRAFKDKYFLRRLAERWLPKSIASRPKTMFRAPWDIVSSGRASSFVDQLLSEGALEQTGYFDVDSVRHWRTVLPRTRGSPRRVLVEHGLAGVVATQLWHHKFIADLGADVPVFERPAPTEASEGLMGDRSNVDPRTVPVSRKAGP